MNNIENLTELNEILSKHDFTILKMSTDWCGPCKRIAPAFSRFSKDDKYKIVFFAEVDLDISQDICKEYNPEGRIPTFVLFKNDDKISSFSGADENKLRTLLDSVC